MRNGVGLFAPFLPVQFPIITVSALWTIFGVPFLAFFAVFFVGEFGAWCCGVGFAADVGVIAFAEPEWWVFQVWDVWVDDFAVDEFCRQFAVLAEDDVVGLAHGLGSPRVWRA